MVLVLAVGTREAGEGGGWGGCHRVAVGVLHREPAEVELGVGQLGLVGVEALHPQPEGLLLRQAQAHLPRACVCALPAGLSTTHRVAAINGGAGGGYARR